MPWPPVAPPPTSELGVYRILSPRAGVRVSPLCLGAMSIGSAWERHGMGAMSKVNSFQLLDEFVKLGGNFIDTVSGSHRFQNSSYLSTKTDE